MQGTWDSDFGELRLLQNDTRVYGDYKNVGMIKGTIKGNLVSGTFTNGSKKGKFRWILDDKSFKGKWAWEGQTLGGKWNATLKSSKKPILKNSKSKKTSSTTNTRSTGLTSQNIKPTKPKDYSGRYRITISNIYTYIGKTNNFGGDKTVEIYGAIGVRLKGKGDSGNVEIKSIGNKNPRLWDVKSSNSIKTTQSNSAILGGGSVDIIEDPTGELMASAGKIEVDKMREFLIKGELANSHLMVNIQCNLTDWNLTLDTKFGWKQRNLYVKNMKLGKEYLLRVDKGKNVIGLGFILEKI